MGDRENKLLIREFINNHNRNYVKILKCHYPDLVEWVNEKTKFLDCDEYKFSTKIYCALNDINDIHRCETCGKEIKNIISFERGYAHCCCRKCTSNNIDVQNKIKQTMTERYGVEYPSQCKEVAEKRKQTMLERYGVENVGQSKEFREKVKKNNLERYGVENVFQSEEVKEKIKQTCLKKYGVEWPSQSDKIREKIKRTNLERYGFESPMQNDEIKKKMIKTIYSKKEAE